jgi:RNA-directed DNA polymerase
VTREIVYRDWRVTGTAGMERNTEIVVGDAGRIIFGTCRCAFFQEIYHVPVGTRHCVQGAPTSPGICNVITLRLDRRLSGLARKNGFAYTRYADDLTFSGAGDRSAAQKLRIAASRIIREEGFTVNADKTRAASQSTCQRVTGVVVNQVLGLSRQQRRQLRAQAHRLHRESAAGTAPPQQIARLLGQRAYLAMLNPEQAGKLKWPA